MSFLDKASAASFQHRLTHIGRRLKLCLIWRPSGEFLHDGVDRIVLVVALAQRVDEG